MNNNILDKVLNVLSILLAIAILFVFLYGSEIRTKKVMSVDYCFDSNGNNYVMPDERCNN